MTNPVAEPDPHYWATGYPYYIPEHSYVIMQGHVERVTSEESVPDLASRHPVIACGSNQSPERLLQKFGTDDEPVFVIRTRIKNFDSVYSAHFARYGSIPATLQYCKGTTVTLSITWLTVAQLKRMNESEAENYRLCRLDRLSLIPEVGAPMQSAFAYISRWGCITNDDTPVALAAVPAEGRRWLSLLQADMLDHVRHRLAPDHALSEFITQNQDAEQTRHAHADNLRRDAVPFAYEFFEVMD